MMANKPPGGEEEEVEECVCVWEMYQLFLSEARRRERERKASVTKRERCVIFNEMERCIGRRYVRLNRRWGDACVERWR